MELHGGDHGPAEAPAGVQAAVACDDLPSVADAPHGDRVQETVGRDVVGEILQVGGVKFEPAVFRVDRGDRVDRQGL